MNRRLRSGCALVVCSLAAACRPGPPPAASSRAATAAPSRAANASRPLLPTGVQLDPAGPSFDVGNMPLAIAPAPGPAGRYVLLLSGWREQGLQVVDAGAGKVLQTLPQAGAFLGLAFSPDGRTLYASGGDEDAVFRYDWRDGSAALRDRLPLAAKEKGKPGTRFPAGLAVSPDGSRLYAAENLGDALAVVDVATGQVVQRLPTERFPYGVAAAPDGTVYVSAWGGGDVAVLVPRAGRLVEERRVPAGRHPSSLLLNAGGSRLFVASASTDRVTVVDTRERRAIATLFDPPPAGPAEGSTPNALALSPDGSRLYVAEADNNAIAVFDLAPGTAGVPVARGNDRLAGRIPCQWYPTALAANPSGGGSLLVVNGKGRGAGPNPRGPRPDIGKPDPRSYTLGQLDGTVTVLPARFTPPELAAWTERAARANGWRRGRPPRRYPPFKHVVYILKENRTYDQVFGDLPAGDGDPSLIFFPRAVSPNHHALAERFGLFDRFFVNAEVSNQGHPWSTSGYVTDYSEKTTPSSYAHLRDEGEVGEADAPAGGYLWDLAAQHKTSFRDYGEMTELTKRPDGTTYWRGSRASLVPFTRPDYPGWDLTISDQRRADVWIADLEADAKRGEMPTLELLWLPNDHTSGAHADRPTPRAYMADNDHALGRIVEALSQSPFWRDTLVLVLEDDAQDGADHVDSHRSVLLAISPYGRAGTVHRFVNTTDVLATIEDVLGLGALSHFDHFGRPLADLFAEQPDLRPYHVLPLPVPWTELNPNGAPGSHAALDLSRPDAADDELFNRVLWRAIKGPAAAVPRAVRASVLEWQRGR